jgi:putative hydrolase of the HAD superfamily
VSGTPYSQPHDTLLSYGMFSLEKDPIIDLTAEKLRHLGIKAVLFDLDDTLIYTAEIFRACMAQYTEVVSRSLNLDKAYVGKRLDELNNDGYRKHGVSPDRWPTVLDQLSQELKDKGVVKENIGIIMEIYTIEPRVRAGAKAILGGLIDSDFKLGMVTHADLDWTTRKLTQTGLLSYFDVVEIADVKGDKTATDWKRGMDALGVTADQCLVVGDNLKGDIIPSVSLGARTLWMPSPWFVYREGEVPEGVVQINELSDFWDAVQKLK